MNKYIKNLPILLKGLGLAFKNFFSRKDWGGVNNKPSKKLQFDKRTKGRDWAMARARARVRARVRDRRS